MMTIVEYLWSKFFKKIRGRAIRNSPVDKTSKVEAGSLVLNSSMGRYSFCGYDCKIINTRIGSFCSIADDVIIGMAEHPMLWVSTSPVFYKGRDSVRKKFAEFERDSDKITLIGNDVWIGENVLIKSGVKIGDGAVVGMGSVVTKDIPPFEIWAGNPAHRIRDRFSQDIKSEILSIKWWEWNDEKIQHYACYIQNPSVFITRVKELD